MDRFDLLAFSNNWKGERKIPLKSIYREVEKAHFFRLNKRNQELPNSRLELKELESMTGKDISTLLPKSPSHRRKRALLRVARTISDLKQEIKITPESVQQALFLTVKNFFFLKNRILAG